MQLGILADSTCNSIVNNIKIPGIDIINNIRRNFTTVDYLLSENIKYNIANLSCINTAYMLCDQVNYPATTI